MVRLVVHRGPRLSARHRSREPAISRTTRSTPLGASTAPVGRGACTDMASVFAMLPKRPIYTDPSGGRATHPEWVPRRWAFSAASYPFSETG